MDKQYLILNLEQRGDSHFCSVVTRHNLAQSLPSYVYSIKNAQVRLIRVASQSILY